MFHSRSNCHTIYTLPLHFTCIFILSILCTNNIKIIETSTDTITLQTEDGDITLTSSGNGNIELDAPIQIGAGNKILSSDGNDIQFDNGLSITGSVVLSGTVDGVDIAGLETDVTTLRGDLNTHTSSNDSTNTIQTGRLDSLETESGSVRGDLNTFTSSINTTIKSKLNTESVVSGSIQIDVTQTTNYNQITDRLVSVENYTSSVDGGLEFTGSNVTVKGNLLVKGTETRVNSTTVEVDDNIISLNGTGATEAGIEVRDVTSPGILSHALTRNHNPLFRLFFL
jgi:hypothetical protein